MPSVLFFCAQSLVARPISQRIAAFGAFLAARGWGVHLTALDPTFAGRPFTERDPYSGMDVEIVGPTHFRVDDAGRRVTTSPAAHLRECHDIARRLRDRAAAEHVDHVVLSTTLPASLYAVVALRRAHRSVWLDVDDWSAAQFSAGGGGRLVASAFDAVERTVPRAAHHMTVCSRELQELFRKAALVPNFIRLADVPEPARTPHLRPVPVAFASSVTAYHGHLPLLEALARRRRDSGAIVLRVIGDGDALEQCRALVDQRGLADVVQFTGRLERRDMLDELSRAEISVLPLHDTRLDRARFPLKLLDSLACGCAVAASDAGMAHETLTDGVSARLSPAGDMDALVGNVLELAADPGLRTSLSEAGRKLVRDFDESAVCERWMTLLSDA